MSTQNIFACKLSQADRARKHLDVTHAVHRRQMSRQCFLFNKPLVAHITLVFTVFPLSVRRVVVSADRWLVAERHRTKLTL